MAEIDEHGFVLHVQGHCLRVVALEDDMIRVSLLRHGKRALARTWMVAPGAPDVADVGMSKDGFEGFAAPIVAISHDSDGELSLETNKMRCVVNTLAAAPIALRMDWWSEQERAWLPLMRDRPTGAYYFSRHG